MTKRLSRPELVIEHLKRRGHISAGTALVEHGSFRLADAIHRLRTDRSDLVPPGMEIVTMHKQDTNGNPYGEYHYVEKRSAAVRRMVDAARTREEAAAPFQKQFTPGSGVSAEV